MCEFACVFANILERLRTIGIPAGVADVHIIFGRQEIDQGSGNSEASKTRVKNADRPFHVFNATDEPQMFAVNFELVVDDVGCSAVGVIERFDRLDR